MHFPPRTVGLFQGKIGGLGNKERGREKIVLMIFVISIFESFLDFYIVFVVHLIKRLVLFSF